MSLNYKEAYLGIVSKNEWQLDSYELAIHSMLLHLIEKVEDLEQENRSLHNRIEELSSIKTRPAERNTAINPLSNGSEKGYTK